MSTLGQQSKNERRKAQRRVAKLDKLLKSKDISKSLRKSYQYERKQLVKNIEQTYLYDPNTRKRIQGRTDETRKKAIELLSRANMRNDYLVHSQRANNKMIEQQIRLAKAGQVSIYSKEEIQQFYAATKSIWQGVPVTQRNEAIMTAFGNENLQMIVEAVLSEYKQRKDEAYMRYYEMGLNDIEANTQWEIDSAESGRPDSPPYLGQISPNDIDWNMSTLYDLISTRNE